MFFVPTQTFSKTTIEEKSLFDAAGQSDLAPCLQVCVCPAGSGLLRADHQDVREVWHTALLERHWGFGHLQEIFVVVIHGRDGGVECAKISVGEGVSLDFSKEKTANGLRFFKNA